MPRASSLACSTLERVGVFRTLRGENVTTEQFCWPETNVLVTRLIFEQMLGYANPLGLYAEEAGTHGEALGNFPQAFTHLALVRSIYTLDRALDG